MTFFVAAQQAIYTRLNGAISATVYDDVPILPDGMPAANFPYVVIGADTYRPWETDDRPGAEMTVTLHIWSRYGGMKQAKQIAQEIHGRLNRHQLDVPEHNTIDCLFEFADFMTDTDGETRHGVVRYRLTVQDLATYTPPDPQPGNEW